MCPLMLTTALKVCRSFTKYETWNEHFFRHQFIRWLLKSHLGIGRGDLWVLAARMFGGVLGMLF